MKKKALKGSLILFVLFLSLGWVPITCLYLNAGTQLHEDPIEDHLPKGLSRIVYSYFAPAMADEVANISFHQSQQASINVAGCAVAGIYDPIMQRIALAAQYDGDRLVVHEILHHVWFQGLVPEQDSFDEDFQRLRTDPGYMALASYVQGRWEVMRANGEIRPLRLTELYSYLGDYLAARRQPENNPGFGLPDYMARHYQGVLREDLIADLNRQYPRLVISWDRITATYHEGPVPVQVVDQFETLQALHERGGVLGWDFSRHQWVVKRLATTKAVDCYEAPLPANLPAAEIRIMIYGKPASDLFLHATDDRNGVAFGVVSYLAPVDDGWNWYTIDWPTLVSLREQYLSGRLRDSSVTPSRETVQVQIR